MARRSSSNTLGHLIEGLPITLQCEKTWTLPGPLYSYVALNDVVQMVEIYLNRRNPVI